MPSLADGKVKIAFAARNSFDWTDTKISDFLTVQSMVVNSRSLKTDALRGRFRKRKLS